MRLIIALIILFALTSSASAGSISRTVNIEDSTIIGAGANYTYKTATITLNPEPFSDFSLPGYLAEEYIPNGATLVETNADWYKQDGSKIAMLRFNPTQDTAKLTYKLKFPTDGGTYILTGKFLDRSRAKGDITSQEIKIDKPMYSGTSGTSLSSSSGNNNTGNYWGIKDEVKATTKAIEATPVALIAAQKLKEPDGSSTYLWRMVLVVTIIVGVVLAKRYGSRSLSFLLPYVFLKRIWDKVVITEYVFMDIEQEKAKEKDVKPATEE